MGHSAVPEEVDAAADAGGVQGRPPDNARVAVAAISSPRTVEHHLHEVFGKLDISSRTELGGALPGEPNAPLPV
jgi:hypothetical protein